MRPNPSCSIFLSVTAAVVVACSSSNDGESGPPPSPDSGPPVTAASACEHQFRVLFDRCVKNIAQPEMTTIRTRWVASCAAELTLTGANRSADQVEACASAIEAEACGVITDLLPACLPKAGTLPESAACNIDGQCQSLHCDRGDVSAPAGCGRCAPTQLENEACAPKTAVCALGTACLGTPTQPGSTTCKRGRYVDAGATCNGIDILCRPSFVCVQKGEEPPTCLPAFAPGESCNNDSACREDAFCSRATEKCTSRAKQGEACSGDIPCAAGLGCDKPANTCAPLTFVAPEVACGGSVECLQGICGQGTGAPSCPRVVEDGKGCLEGAHMTCRAPATCVRGTCATPTTSTCK